MKSMKIERKRKLPLFVHDITIHIENPKDYIPKLLE
jgi:hypothetical protein